jgi:hypothetical protein
MIVAVHGLIDDMSRLHEYSPGFEPEQFAAHEKFFVEDVRSKWRLPSWSNGRHAWLTHSRRPRCQKYSGSGLLHSTRSPPT